MLTITRSTFFQRSRSLGVWSTPMLGLLVGCVMAERISLALDIDQGAAATQEQRGDVTVRVATFNVALNRGRAGELTRELSTGESSQAKNIAEVIQRVRPKIILLNEVDYDPREAIGLLQQKYLSLSQNGQPPIQFPYSFCGPVNTGVDSGLDLNGDGRLATPDDAFGYGQFPGQYGMVVLSQYPIDVQAIRTFQKFLWRDMPDPLLPLDPMTGESYYSEQVLDVFRLPSKSVWDVPILIGEKTIHLVCSHPTPPVFDGREDRNGRRNHDEIRLLADFVSGTGDYLYDDQGHRGGLSVTESFVIAGDLNADPEDGESLKGAIGQLLSAARVNAANVPTSRGAVRAAERSAGANLKQSGDSAADTGDFSDDSVGNLRVDYLLPSRDLRVGRGGVFWPAVGEPGAELSDASDHHLVWLEIHVPSD